MYKVFLSVAALMMAARLVLAETVHVTVQTIAGTVTNVITDAEAIETGDIYESCLAPAIEGYLFTQWKVSTDQEDFEPRDCFGRAKDAVALTIYEDTLLTACYVQKSEDADGDGVADGYQLYWYGSLDVKGDSDSDKDGFTFAEELAVRTNPLFPEDIYENCGVSAVQGSLVQLNPYMMNSYVIRSEPEWCLFETKSDYVRTGTILQTGSYDWKTTKFAYWTVNGVRQCDTFGRALDQLSIPMPTEVVEIVAVCNDNEAIRAKLYWYGSADVAADSDTDSDGFTLDEELAAGTNPLLPESVFVNGGVDRVAGDLVQLNPGLRNAYVIRSDPEGGLFETLTDYVEPGMRIETDAFDWKTSHFAYWTINGARQCDPLGRALDFVSILMPPSNVELIAVCEPDEISRAKLYWYGRNDVSMDSDSDGDGFTFEEELAAGTNPLLPENLYANGGVGVSDADSVEINEQSYEQLQGAVVGGKFTELFTSPTAGNAATSATFGSNLQPVVVDVNGDGLWDFVLVYEAGVKVLVNVGAKGNPEFEERAVDVSAVDLAMNSTEKLAAMALDVAPIGALSATVWGEMLLVSDDEGRIWFYTSQTSQTPHTSQTFALQHKVWGGSHPGFADGLRLAAVDWDDDGDLDCLCGTAEGKLMLLRDPKVGRPTNLRALVGVDNVKLDWDPNQQSRIRGYKVYRADAGGDDFTSLVSPYTPLPTYRDYPPSVSDFDYKVSSVSRYYVAGNSEPIVSESPATEAVRASLGKVSLHWNDVVAKRGETFSLMLSIDNSASLSPEGMTIEIEYDHAVLSLLKMLPSGLFEQDKIAPGSGKLYEYVFEIVESVAPLEPLVTEVAVKSATMYGLGGARVAVSLPKKSAVVSIAAGGSALYQLGDLNGDGKVDTLDLRELAKLKSAAGRKWTASQLKAGDFNGNGKLDDADYQALGDLLKERGEL